LKQDLDPSASICDICGSSSFASSPLRVFAFSIRR
jgi:hypothetical protein